MLPTKTTDVWAKANEANILQALALLAGLPSRQADDAHFDKEVFFLALDGVTRHGLSEAVKAVLQNKLGHAFFPSPPELRGLCDAAMEHHVRMRDRIAHRQRIEADRIPEKPPLSEAEKERQRQRMRDFYRAIGRGEEADETTYREAMRAKYGDAIDNVPDAPDRGVPGFTKAA